jgi:hypothetical protein
VFLPLQKPDSAHSQYYRLAAACWEKVWLGVYDRFNVQGPLFLDNLIRQDEAACIFTPDDCVGIILFRIVDFDVLNYRRDSYFKEWTDQDVLYLLQSGPRVFLSSYLTVNPKFRSYSSGLKFKEVFLDIMVQRFLESPADVIAGIARRDRSLNDESVKLGARVVRENVDYFNGREHVDLVAFFRSEIRRSPNPAAVEFCDRLWKNRLDLSNLGAKSAVKAA